MELLHKKKDNQTSTSPILVMWEDKEQKKKIIKKIKLGEVLTVPDQIGYELMSRYVGSFEVKQDGYKTKVMKPE